MPSGRDDLKPLALKIEEVDKRRQEDKEAISEEIKKLAAHLEKLLTAAVAEPSPKSSIKTPPAGDGARDGEHQHLHRQSGRPISNSIRA